MHGYYCSIQLIATGGWRSTDEEKLSRMRCELETIRSERDSLRVRLDAIIQQRELERKYNSPCKADPSGHDGAVMAAKPRILSLEMQLSAACAAKNNTQNQLERLSAKLETTSKALYEVSICVI